MIAGGVFSLASIVWMCLSKDAALARATKLALLPIGLATAFACMRVLRHPEIDRTSWEAWRFLAVGFLLRFVGDVCWVHVENVVGLDPSATWVNAPRLLAYPFLLSGLMEFRLGVRGRGNLTSFYLDLTATVASGGLLVWWFLVRPARASGSADLVSLLPAIYPLLDVVLLVGVGRILLHRLPGGASRPLDVVAGGILVGSAANVVWASSTMQDAYRSGGLADALWMTSRWLVLVGACAAHRRVSLRVPEDVHVSPRVSLVPYAAIGTAYALVAWAAAFTNGADLPPLAIGATAMTLLVIARQVVAVRQTVRLQAERAAHEGELRFRSLVQNSSDAIMVLDMDGTISYASPSVEKVVRVAPALLEGRPLLSFCHPEDATKASHLLRGPESARAQATAVDWRFRRGDGTWTTLETVSSALVGEAARREVVLNSRDVTDRRLLEEQLAHQALHDSLTDLPNRALFRDRVDHALARAARRPGDVCVLFVDLDHFKSINDGLGHESGDRVLVAAAARLRTCLRSDDTPARLGGDEFAVLLEDIASPVDATQVAKRVTAAFREPFPLDGHHVMATASVGLAFAEPGDSAATLLRNADTAMYVAKSRGRGRFVTFETSMHVGALNELEIRGELHQAVERGDLHVRYQPLISLQDGSVVGAEALVRWQHPTRGVVPPGEFIPLAEQTGLIVPIGRFVLATALRDLAAWRASLPDGEGLHVAVNVSVLQLRQEEFVDEVRAAIEAAGVPPSAVTLEITESGLLADGERSRDTLRRLKDLGVSLAVDDFGEGYSSLSYLQRLPLDVLKVPKPFVDVLASATGDAALPRAILSLAASLGLATVAEGIEHERQARELAALGCTYGQGWLWSRAVASSAFEVFVRARKAAAPTPRQPLLST